MQTQHSSTRSLPFVSFGSQKKPHKFMLGKAFQMSVPFEVGALLQSV